MATTVTPVTYAKNVLRSAGYIGVESLKGVNGTLVSYISESAETVKNTYDTAKRFAKNPRSMLQEYIGEDTAKAVTGFGKNILDDVRTGNFYNPDRERSDQETYYKNELGFNFDDLDLDVDEDLGEGTKSSSGDPTRAINNLSKTNQQLTVASTDAITNTLNKNNSKSVAANAKMVGMMNNSLMTINSSINALHRDLVSPLNSHIQNSTAFYKTATEELSKQTKYLENINNILTDRYSGKSKGRKQGKMSAWEDIMSDSMPSISKIFGHAKNNFMNKSAIGQTFQTFLPMLSDAIGSGALSSPIALIATMVLGNALSNSSLGRATDRTVNIFKGGIGNLFTRIHDYNRNGRSWEKNKKTGEMQLGKHKNPILGFLASMFDFIPNRTSKGGMDFGSYDKGPVSWTGKDAKALRDVIPAQLATIISLLSGKEPQIFDYDRGVFKTKSKLQKEFTKNRLKNLSDSNYEFKDQMVKDFMTDHNATHNQKINYGSRMTEDFSKDFDRIMMLITNNSEMNPTNSKFENAAAYVKEAKKRKWDQLLSNPRSLERIAAILFKDANKKYIKAAKVNYSYADTRYMNNHGYSNAEESTFAFNTLFNGNGIKNNSINVLGKDNKGNDIFFYLQSYYKQLDYLVNNISSRSGRKRGKKKPFSYGNDVIPSNGRTRGTSSNFIAPSRTREEDEYDIKDYNTGGYKKNTSNIGFEDYDKADERDVVSSVSDFYDRHVNNFFSRLLFGFSPNKDDITDGLIGKLKEGTQKIADSIKEIGDKIKGFFKDTWDKFKTKFFGSDFGKRYTGKLKSMATGAKDTVVNEAKNDFNFAKNKFTGIIDSIASVGSNDSGTAAYGGQVRRSGMVSVSEGELIVPAERNPFYKKSINKANQRVTENRNLNRWIAGGSKALPYWGSYADGGIVGYIQNHNTKELADKAKHSGIVGYIRKHNTKELADKAKQGAGRYTDKLKESGSSMLNSGLAQGIGSIFSFLFGKYAEEVKIGLGNIKNKHKSSSDLGKDILTTLKKQFPETMATGTVGALVGGGLTGSGLGLLGGFVAGAGINIVKNSESISKFIFGEYDKESDTYKGGKLPDKMVKFIKNKAPAVAKSAALGGILGAIGIAPGGVIGGIVAGTTIQILYDVKTIRTTAMDILFGHEDVNGKRNGGILGSLRTRVIDPIADYVQDGLKNITKYFKENFFNPIKHLMNPVSDWIKGAGMKLLLGIGNTLKKTIDNVVKDPGQLFDRTIGRVLGFGVGTGEKIGNTIAKVGKVPGKIVNKAADVLEAHNIKKGYSTLDAAERVRITGNKATGYNRTLADLYASGNEKEARKYTANAFFYSQGRDDAKSDLEKYKREQNQTITNSLVNAGMGNPQLVKRLEKVLYSKDTENGDYSKAIEMINGLSENEMTSANKEKVLALINDMSSHVKSTQNRFNTYDQDRANFFRKHKEFGVKVNEDGSINDLEKQLSPFKMQAYTDMSSIRKSTREAFEKEHNAKIENETKLKEQDRENPQGARTNEHLVTLVELVRQIASNTSNDEETTINASTTAPSTASSNAVKNTIKNSTKDKSKDRGVVGRIERLIKDGKTNQEISTTLASSGIVKSERFIQAVRNNLSKTENEQPAPEPLEEDTPTGGSTRASFLSRAKDFYFGHTIQGRVLSSVASGIGNQVSAAGQVMSNSISDARSNMRSGMSSAGSQIKSGINGIKGLWREAKWDAYKNQFIKQEIANKTNGYSEGNEPKEGDTRTNPISGLKEEFRRGEWVTDKSDAETKQALSDEQKDRELRNNFFSFVLKGGLISSLGSLFLGNKKDEKKESLWDKLKGIASGVGTFFSTGLNTLSNLLSGGLSSLSTLIAPITSAVGNIVSKAGGAANAVAGAGAAIGLGGTAISFLDSIKNHGSEGVGSVLSHTFEAADNAEAAVRGYKRTYYDEGEYQGDYTVKRTFLTSMKQAVLGRNIPGIAGGVYNLAGKGIRGIAKSTPKVVGVASKGVGTVAKGAFSAVSKVGSKVVSALPESVGRGINKVLEKAVGLFGKFTKGGSGIVTKLSGHLKSLSDDIAAQVSKLLGKDALKKIAAKANVILLAVNYILAMENGWEDAQANLGILDTPTTGERFLSALAAGVSELILGLLTPDFLIDKLLWVAEYLGMDVADLQEKRAAAKQEMEDYNNANPGHEYNTVKEYLKNHYDLKTTQDRIKETVGKGFSTVKNAVKNTVSKIAPTAKNIGTKAIEGAKKVGGFVQSNARKIYDSVVPALGNGVKSIGNALGETLDPAVEQVKKILGKINDNLPYLKESVTSITGMMARVKDDFTNPETGLKEMMAEKAEVSEKNPFAGLTSAVGTGVKVLETPVLLVSAALGKISKSVIQPLVSAIGPAISTSITEVATNIGSAIKGDLGALWTNTTDLTEESDNSVTNGGAAVVGTLVNTASKIFLTVPTAASWVIHKIAGAIIPAAKGIGNGINGMITGVSDAFSYMKNGDLSGLVGFTQDESIEGDDELSGIGNLTNGIVRGMLGVVLTPFTAINWLKKKFDSFWDNKVKDTDLGKMIDELNEYKDPEKKPDMSGYEDVIDRYTKNGTVGEQFGLKIMGFINEIPVQIVRTVKKGFNFAAKGFNTLKNWLLGNEGDASTDNTSTTYTTENGTHGGGGRSLDAGGFSGAHVQQLGNSRFAGSTLGKMGCGPAAAATVLRAYGKDAELNDAANYASSRGYVAGASGSKGTKASYFRDILGSNGISTAYTSNSNAINRAVGSGNPTVLLGQDKSNTSKANSPFGPNPHYVVTRGTDRRGNVVVEDPELNRTALYNKNILKSAKLGVMTGGDSGITEGSARKQGAVNQLAKMREAAAAAGMSVGDYQKALRNGTVSSYTSIPSTTSSDPSKPKATNNQEAIWGYLKSNYGLSDGAIAGIMGNIKQESAGTFSPKATEYLFINHLQGKNDTKWSNAGNIYKDAGVDVTSYDSAWNSYTNAIDNKKISLDEFEHPYKEYATRTGNSSYKSDKSKTGHEWLQYGYGLTQFTSPSLKEQLYNETVGKGKSIADLGSQLNVLRSQLEAANVWGTLTNGNVSAETAAKEMLLKYERPANAEAEVINRQKYANDILAAYKGKNFDYTDYTMTNGFSNVASINNATGEANTAAASASDGSATSTGLSGIITNAFSKVFGGIATAVGGTAGKLLNIIFGLGSSGGNTTSNSTNTTGNAASLGAVSTSSGNTTQENNIITKMNSILGTCSYSMSGARNPEKGSADCSSTVQWVLKKAIGVDPGGDTPSILNGANGITVDKYSSGDPLSQNSSGPNLDNLRPGDLLLYSRPTSAFSAGRNYRVGHVEMYMGNGKRAGHGSGTGPKVTDAMTDAGRYILAKRYTTEEPKKNQNFKSVVTDAMQGTGSGLPIYDFTGGASGVISSFGTSDRYAALKSISTGTTATSGSNGTNFGSVNNKTLTSEEYFKGVLELLNKISSNTSYNSNISTIVDVLKNIITLMSEGKTSTSSVTAVQSANKALESAKKDGEDNIDQTLSTLMKKLDSISTYA